MHPEVLAQQWPDKPAYIIAETGAAVSFSELNDLSNQAAQLFRKLGLRRGDHIALMTENHPVMLQICVAAERAGLYHTAISYRLQKDEVDYIVADCQAKAFITTIAQREVVTELSLDHCDHAYVIDGELAGFESWEQAVRSMPAEPIADESMGAMMLYSSGTTGRPKGILQPLPDDPVGEPSAPNMQQMLWGVSEESTYLVPAPLYHAAPLASTLQTIALGGTAVVMKHFEAETCLQAIETYRVTHGQFVPTMFIRMLKLDEAVRKKYDLSSLTCAIHAAAPCPIPVKEQMIEWWGPIIGEYYAGTEAAGFTTINSEEWLKHKGSVGRPMATAAHIVGDDGEELPVGEAGTIYFEGGAKFEYFNDEAKTKDAQHPKGWATYGDVGYLDTDGYLYLTDRKSFMIISGGVNIYPQETENLLVTHPKVMDVAVFGVPHPEFGEEVKAVVQPVHFEDAGPDLEAELIEFCREHISHIKSPKSVDFEEELPRHPTGKLYKRLLRDRYWAGH